MHGLLYFGFGVAAGLAVGTAYGRSAEQKAIALALTKFAKIDADARQALAYLKGLPHATEARLAAIFKLL